MKVLVVMGVSGVGKTAVAVQIVARTGRGFAEGEDLLPDTYRAKPATGDPLDDSDRGPWLQRIANWIGTQEAAGRSAVVTCSALDRSDRDLLRDGHPSVQFVHLLAPPAVIRQRSTGRSGRFTPSSPDGRLATPQALEPDEPGCAVDTTGDPSAVAALVLFAVGTGVSR
ncbi:gluconokinase [Pseudonocardia saturnea]